MALLDYPITTIPHAGSSRLGESQSAATFPKRVWELHYVIVSPRSRVIQVKSAKASSAT
jgi:hypothetical protein